jgi:DNA-binding transcriptional ArsR family regulator
VTAPTLLRAVAHPLRLQMLSLLTSRELSAAEIARELDTSQANASYHLRVLAAAGLLVPAGQVKIRGGTARRYRHPWRSEDRPSATRPASPIGPLDHQLLIQAIASELHRRSTQHGEGKNEFVDAELWVDPSTWEKCVQMVHEAALLFHSAAEPPHTDGTVKVAMSAAMFPLVDAETPLTEADGLGAAR